MIADGLSEKLREKALNSLICKGCEYEEKCNKKEMPRIAFISQTMLHKYFNTEKKIFQGFEFIGGFVNQPDWFIEFYSEIDNDLAEYKKELLKRQHNDR